jgi:hypothetical protein
MRIFEVVDTKSQDQQKLAALSQFLLGRSQDTDSKKEIGRDAFINYAKLLGVNVTPTNIADYVGQEPLSNILEPMDPASDTIMFKDPNAEPISPPEEEAEAIVKTNADKALQRSKQKNS